MSRMKDLAGQALSARQDRQTAKQERLNSLDGLDVAEVRKLLGHSSGDLGATFGWGSAGGGLSDAKTSAIVNAMSANTHATLLVVKRLEELIDVLEARNDPNG